MCNDFDPIDQVMVTLANLSDKELECIGQAFGVVEFIDEYFWYWTRNRLESEMVRWVLEGDVEERAAGVINFAMLIGTHGVRVCKERFL